MAHVQYPSGQRHYERVEKENGGSPKDECLNYYNVSRQRGRPEVNEHTSVNQGN